MNNPLLTRIDVTSDAIDLMAFSSWLADDAADGAVVTFLGKVRQLEQKTEALILEHYPIMTERTLQAISAKARERWSLNRIAIVHRIGEIHCNESIVFVGVSSAHRSDAFAASEFIMDYLKTEAPFWKKERTIEGEHWVDAKSEDQNRAKQWHSR